MRTHGLLAFEFRDLGDKVQVFIGYTESSKTFSHLHSKQAMQMHVKHAQTHLKLMG